MAVSQQLQIGIYTRLISHSRCAGRTEDLDYGSSGYHACKPGCLLPCSAAGQLNPGPLVRKLGRSHPAAHPSSHLTHLPAHPPQPHLGHPGLALRVAVQAGALRLRPIIHRLNRLRPAGTAAPGAGTAATAAALQSVPQARMVLVQQRGGLVQDVVRV